MTAFFDLLLMQENERIRLIVEKARTSVVGVILEREEPEKIARYKRKVLSDPAIELASETPLSAGTILLKFQPKRVPTPG